MLLDCAVAYSVSYYNIAFRYGCGRQCERDTMYKATFVLLMLIDSAFFAEFVYIYAHSRFQRIYSSAKAENFPKGNK